VSAKDPDPKQIGRYYAMAQVGLEMAAPIGIGAFLDTRFGWLPWATIAGALLGLGGGLYHLVKLLNQDDATKG
jgi:F0F1-type ATP synthase assembly protein I